MTQQSLLGQEGGAFTGGIRDLINANFTDLYGSLITVGKVIYLDPAAGNDTNDGTSLANAVATLSVAYGAATAGKNDVIVLVGNGQASGSARLSSAFTWAKDATHLVGIAAPTRVGGRARIAPTSGATAFTPFMTISGDGCIFQNIHWFHGFGTGTTAQICITLTGERNYFKNSHIAGMGDQESADDAGSRSLKIGSGGNGEHTFVDCTIGLDTITRGAANASVEFTGATPRNSFYNCTFPFQTDAATPLGIITSGSGALDRWALFQDCAFINNIQSTSTQMTAIATLAASPGGLIFLKSCSALGATDWGTDATSKALIYLDGAAPTAATSGLALVST